MKKMNKKRGFTIVELSIVIGVIAILAGVLVPTFSGIVKKSKESAALQRATSAYHVALGSNEDGTFANETADPDAYIVVDEKYYFELEDGKLERVESLPDDLTTKYTALTAEQMGENMSDVVFHKANN